VAELLLELLSEEIPARMQGRAAEELKRLVGAALKEAGLEYEKARAYVTPRRLALVVDGLPLAQPDVTVEQKGPRADAPEKAIAGFLRSVGLTRDQVEERQTKKGAVLFAVEQRQGRATAELLPELLPGPIQALPWPKSMRWGAGSERWVRPLHGVLCLFDGAQVALGVGQVVAGETTRGHRVHAPEPFAVRDFADYRDKLRQAFVILDAGEREAEIEAQAGKLAAAEGLALEQHPAMLAENAGLVEWPVVLMGGIDARFMDLPPEVLTTVMHHHQKYLALRGADGALAPRFIVVAGSAAEDGGKAMVAGNERVLRARLADARFFWDQDRKASLESRLAALDGVIFHAKLGSLGDKAKRLAALSAYLAPLVPGAEAEPARRAALLAKADLTTDMVVEFPELQGVMGRYYARHDGESEACAEAVAEHYAPRGPGDGCPTAPASVVVALADKIDTLVGLFAIDERPTGSKDPFALRRAALGAIRLVLENGLRLSLRQLFEAAVANYAGVWGAKATPPEGLSDDLLGFFTDRLKVHLRGQGVRHDLISAVFALTGEDDLVRLLARVRALAGFLDSEDGANLLTAYRRASNIVRIEEKRDGASYQGEADAALLAQAEETELVALLGEVSEASAAALDQEAFAEAMSELARLRAPVDHFFDEVTVNADDAELRRNRLRLLSQIRATLGAVADFSQIEG
jgi:glycyl-tRNA synthetase beta chain